MVSWCFLILLAALSVVIEGQPTQLGEGFISIDCGLTNGTSYNDGITRIRYVSDDSYIDTGIKYNISKDYTSPSRRTSTVRSFPNETRNCYMLRNLTKSSTYLLRATFLYGNYDGNQTAQVSNPLQFDLYLGITFWTRVKITNASREYNYEVITVPKYDFIWLCLVNISKGTPFISALELRPLKDLYSEVVSGSGQSCALVFRLNYGPTRDTLIRYPDDPYDRIWSWYEYDNTILTSINTKENITRYDGEKYEAPNSVLQTALTPVSSPNLTTIISFDPPENFSFNGYYDIIFQIAELQDLSQSQSREFNISLYDTVTQSAVKPKYLNASYYHIFKGTYNDYVFTQLAQLSNSTLPPIINALELYWEMNMKLDGTNFDDVGLIMAVKDYYQIVKNWNGDPCYPTNESWHGVNCNENGLDGITSLNLSYFDLHGDISGLFAKLKNITYLDLSHNNLRGDIPDSFTTLPYLGQLNLLGNNIGRVPDTFLKKNNSGTFILLIDSCTNCGGAKSKKSSSTLIIAIVVAVIAIVVSIAALLFILILHRRISIRRGVVRQNFETQVHSEIKRFTYQELKGITKTFSRIIGKGGFGVVYHGHLENQIEVAVKVCSPESGQGSKQFLAEVKSLSLVHHKNLVTLVGYCKEGDELGVVYEYMARGSLFDHLRGKDSTFEHLNWRMRLNIALEAAQGLDYLHTGCGIVHRDVKSSNILLGQNFEAKVSDLGLARMFSADSKSSLITLCGTPGYIDPEYQLTLVLTDKSDVYSFGIILLEIVTGEPPIINSTESIHVVKLVKEKLDEGSIEDVIDSRIKGEYDLNSMLKVVELAMICTNERSAQRPTMADVVTHLRGSVQMEEVCQKGKLQQSDKSDTNTSSFSTSVIVPSQSFVPTTR